MTCPVCGDDSAARWRPFCSRRCADIDLGRWMTGGYAIADADEEHTAERPPDPRPPREEN